MEYVREVMVTILIKSKLITMAKTTIKLSIAIESSRVGYLTRGKMYITDMLFSESINHKLMDAEELIKEVKNAIKLLKGWDMLTIRLTDDLEYTTYPKEIRSVRFTNSYGEIKFAQSDSDIYYSKYCSNWTDGKVNHIYENVRELTKWANNLQLNKVANRNSEVTQ